VVDLACYDSVLLEDSSANKMTEQLLFFESVVNSACFMRTSIILIMDNVGVFKQKLSRSPLADYFPDYTGGGDVEKAAEYLLLRFNQANRAHLGLYCNLKLSDIPIIQWVVNAIKDTKTTNSLNDLIFHPESDNKKQERTSPGTRDSERANSVSSEVKPSDSQTSPAEIAMPDEW
jgi:guanine nucleotide-binding protein G(i) subunit alpha